MIMIKNAMQYDQQIDSRTFYSRWYHNHSVKSFSLSLKFFWGKGERSRGRCQLLPLVATNLLDTSEGGQNLGSTAIFCKFSDMHLFFSSLRNAEHHTAPLPINYYFVLFSLGPTSQQPLWIATYTSIQLKASHTTQCRWHNSHNPMQTIQLAQLNANDTTQCNARPRTSFLILRPNWSTTEPLIILWCLW